jgi:hypothetical protein
MKLYAINLDGPIADIESAFFKRADEMYPDLDLRLGESWDDTLYEHSAAAYDEFYNSVDKSEQIWYSAPALTEHIEEIVKWSYAGVVTSVVTSRPNTWRISTELWLAHNHVPYSNLLFNFNIAEADWMLPALDAGFYIDVEPGIALKVASCGIPAYLIRTIYNFSGIAIIESTPELSDIKNLHIVTYMDEIAEREGIRIRG